MKKIVFFLAVIASQYSTAHTRWIVPSHTILSGDKPEYVSFDFSISNDIFYPDHAYGGMSLQSMKKNIDNVEPVDRKLSPMDKILASTQLQVKLPDGSVVNDTPIINLSRKSSSSFLLKQSGTYQISVTQDPIRYVSFKQANDDAGRLFGSLAEHKGNIPEGARDIVDTKLINTVQTYVTRNAATELKNDKELKGLSLVFSRHPNELFVGELFNATLMVNGVAVAKDTEVHLIKGGTRFRDDRQVRTIKTDAEGMFSFVWDKAGVYLLESEVELDSGGDKSQKIIYSLFVTLEVSQE